MSAPKKPSLRLVEGAGQTSRMAQPGLALVPDSMPSNGQQLALPGVVPVRAVISVSPASLFTRGLAAMLWEVRARHFVDMRLAVEFGSLGLDRRDFDAIMTHLGLGYWHCHVLANRNHDLTWNPSAMWSRFREQLQRDPARAMLLRLRDLVDDGPVVLLSESPYHEESERRLVMEALQEIRPGFAYRPVDPTH